MAHHVRWSWHGLVAVLPVVATISATTHTSTSSLASASAGMVSVALLQLNDTGLDLPGRVSKLEKFLSLAATQGADLAVTPAGWLREAGQHFGAVDIAHAIESVKEAARGNSIAVAVALVNTTSHDSTLHLISSTGKTVLEYTKAGEVNGTPVSGSPSRPVQIDLGSERSVAVGGLLQTDLLFPEPARLLMLGGAELIVTPAGKIAGPLRPDALELFVRSRSRENAVALFAVTTSEDNINSTYSIQGGAATSDGGPGVGEEGVRFASVNLTQLRARRVDTTLGDNYRRPFDYLPLCFEENESTTSRPVQHIKGLQKFTVALLQMVPNTTFNPDDHGAELMGLADVYIRKAAASGADVALLPELWSVGYEAYFPCEPSNVCNNTQSLLKWMRLASPVDGSYITHYQELARELGIAIAASYMEEVSGPGGDPWPPRNSVALIDRHGRLVYNYAKVHTCQFSGLEALHTGGRRVYTGVLETAAGNVTVASIICFDREQMETARMAVVGGAEVILTPNACGLNQATLDHFAVRGMENSAAVCMTNYADAPRWHDATNGHSVAYDHLGHPLVMAAGDPGIYLATIDVSALRTHRQTAFGSALLSTRESPHPALCDFARRPEFGGAGILGRASVPL